MTPSIPDENLEKPEQNAAWRKQILRQMMHGLKRPLITEKGWELMYNRYSKEYSFMIGNTILFIDANGNPDVTKILDNGRIRTSSQKEKMVRLLDTALMEYAASHAMKAFGESEEDNDEPSGLTIDVQPENPAETSTRGVIKKIRHKLKL